MRARVYYAPQRGQLIFPPQRGLDVEGEGNVGARPSGRRELRPVNRPVERVALNRLAPRFADQPLELGAGSELRRGCAGVVVNLLLDDGAVNVVRAEAQRDLRNSRREHDPVGLDVVEVVEQKARDGDVLQVGEAGWLGQMAERGVFRVEGQRDEGDEAAGLVLELAQQQQVLDTLLFCFDVAVEHGGVRAQADLMRRARNVQPLLAGNLVVADYFAHPRIEDFGAAAGQRVHTGLFQGQQSIADRKLGDAREVAHLNHGERLQVHARAALLESSHQVQEIMERQVRVQAADQVKLGGAFADALLGARKDLFERKGVRAGSIGAAAESAQPAMRHADVGGVDVAVDVEVADVAVALLADVVVQPAHGQ